MVQPVFLAYLPLDLHVHEQPKRLHENIQREKDDKIKQERLLQTLVCKR